MTTAPTDRRPDIDWLRVLATLLVVVFHTAMVFNPAPFYHIRSTELSFPLLIFCGFVSLWHMPLFFVLAGWSLGSAITTRSAGQMAFERLARLGVPLLAGIVLFMPWIKYVELRSGMNLNHLGLSVTQSLQDGFRQVVPMGLPVMPEFNQTIRQFLPQFFTDASYFTWAHLWFIAYLFTFTLLLLPLLNRWGRTAPSPRPRSAALVWAPVPLLVIIQLVLRPHWPGIQNLYNDWANVAWYMTFMTAGFALAWDPRLEAMVHKQTGRAFTVGLVTCLVLLGGVIGAYDSPTVLLAGSAVAGWAFLVCILGAGKRYLSFSTASLRYLAEAALPIYLLHQATIVLPGWWILDFPGGMAVHFVLILGTALSLSFGIYHFAIRCSPVLRVLFGMRPLSCPLPAPRTYSSSVAAVTTVAALLLVVGVNESWSAVSPLGRWYAEGGAAQVEVEPCGGALCGRVVWLRSPWDENGCEMVDRENPDASLRERSLIGIHILSDLRPVAESEWDGGTIYDPTSGRTYRCAMTLDGENRLLVRGYLGFRLLGRTTTWRRVGAEGQQCSTPSTGERP